MAPWPRLGLGCAALTAPGAQGERNARAVIEHAWERGIRFFDTAPLYGGGLSEERLGAALEGLPRADYVLTTKTGVTRPYAQGATPPGSTQFRAADVWDFSREATHTSVQRSFERLRTDYLDLVHLHDVEDYVGECAGACEVLAEWRTHGRVRGISVGSNGVHAPGVLMGRGVLDAMLIAGRYTLLDTSAEGLLAQARAAGVRVIAAGVLNSGVLAHGITPQATFDYLPPSAAVAERVQRLQAWCAAQGVGLAAAALQFVARNPHVDSVLLGPRSVSELDELLDAFALPLPDGFWHGRPNFAEPSP
jgi:D-threo-aldose 1-dehydrogenase